MMIGTAASMLWWQRKKYTGEMQQILLHSLVNEQDQYIAIFDFDNHLILANKSFEELIGQPSHKLIGNTLANLKVEQSVDQAFLLNNEQLTPGKSSTITYNQRIRKNKSLHWLEFQKRTLLLKNPTTSYILVVASDISDKKLVEAKLSHTKTEYKELVESAGDTIYRTDIAGNFIYVNNAIKELLGYTSEELLQMNLHDVVFHDDVEKVKEHLSTTLNTETPNSYVECRFVSKSGNFIWTGHSISLQKEHQEISGFQAVARDITAMKEAEAKLKNAKEIAEEASASKSSFIAKLSHEFRTPLNAILGYSQILEKSSSLLTEEKAHIREIQKGGEQLLGMVNDILELSSIESAEVKRAQEHISLKAFMAGMAERFEALAAEKQIAFEFTKPNPATTPTSLQTDFSKISIIVKNLLDNAIKFSSGGSIGLSYNVMVTDSELAFLDIIVTDNGPGLSKQELDQIFQPFWQKDSIRYSGTGLGLTLTERLVSFLGGSITVTNREISGIKAHVQIPVEVPLATERQLVVNKGFGHRPTSINIHRKEKIKILIVDDLEPNRTITRIILNEHGFSFAEAENGEEALELMESYRPDVILMDINMPIMGGLETTLKIRAQDWEFRSIPIIAVTAGNEQEKQELLQQGFSDYILKPFKEAEILNSIHSVLDGQLLKLLEPEPMLTSAHQISAEEVGSYLSTLGSEKKRHMEEVLRMQDFEAIQHIGETFADSMDIDHPVFRRLMEAASEYDYLFASKVLKFLR